MLSDKILASLKIEPFRNLKKENVKMQVLYCLIKVTVFDTLMESY